MFSLGNVKLNEKKRDHNQFKLAPYPCALCMHFLMISCSGLRLAMEMQFFLHLTPSGKGVTFSLSIVGESCADDALILEEGDYLVLELPDVV